VEGRLRRRASGGACGGPKWPAAGGAPKTFSRKNHGFVKISLKISL
jgi:hypothetical protein